MSEASGLLLFVHIPKTAGQTVVQILRNQYRGRFARVDPHAEPDPDRPELQAELREAKRAGNRVIVGHFPYGVGRWLEGPCRYVTFLRDPVDRVISRYYYLIGRPGTPHGDLLRAHPGGLENAIDLQEEFQNWQTRVMAGVREEDGRYDPHEPCTEETLARAKANLKRCAAVGFTERFDESLVLMKLALGWGTPAYVRRNTTKQRPQLQEVPPHVLELIEERNRLDRALYDYGVELFEDALARHRAAVDRELRRLERMNAVYPLVDATRRPARIARRLAHRTRLRARHLYRHTARPVRRAYRRTKRSARRLRRRFSADA